MNDSNPWRPVLGVNPASRGAAADRTRLVERAAASIAVRIASF